MRYNVYSANVQDKYAIVVIIIEHSGYCNYWA